VVTGSQLPLTVYGNDARFNFENAVLTAVLAAEENIAEVMVVFDDVVLRGVRSIKVSESNFRAFASPSYPALADIRSTGISFSQYATKGTDAAANVRKAFDAGVVTIDLVPGMRPDIVEYILESGRCRGLLLKSHGAGSVPTIGEYSFLPLIERCKNKYRIPVLITTKFVGGNAHKDVNDLPAVEAINAGAVSAHDMTDVAAQVKLMWLLAQGLTGDDVKRELELEYCGEMTAERSGRA
jgi:L-asparaginase